jgi:hypothetical protein
VHCCGTRPPVLQAGPFAMPELPSWVSLPEDGPTRKAYFEVYRPGYSLKVRTRSHHQPHRLIGREQGPVARLVLSIQIKPFSTLSPVGFWADCEKMVVSDLIRIHYGRRQEKS